jgi:hypothetical protein
MQIPEKEREVSKDFIAILNCLLMRFLWTAFPKFLLATETLAANELLFSSLSNLNISDEVL